MPVGGAWGVDVGREGCQAGGWSGVALGVAVMGDGTDRVGALEEAGGKRWRRTGSTRGLAAVAKDLAGKGLGKAVRDAEGQARGLERGRVKGPLAKG